MARLPADGGDLDAYGAVLNEFLLVAHDANGNLKAGAVTPAKVTNVFGAWATAVQDSSTQAAKDSFIVIVIDQDIDIVDWVSVKTDSSNPPTTVRAVFEGFNTGASGRLSLMCLVIKGDYYLIENNNLTPIAYILPIGT